MGERVTINDVRAAGFCAAGLRRWFEGHGLDLKDFLRNGMALEDVVKINDAMAARVVARKRATDGL